MNTVDGFDPAVYSLDLKCANCTDFPAAYALGFFLILELIPGALFFICLVVFNLNITSGPLLGYVLFCQVYAYTLQQELFVYDYTLSDVAWPLRVLFSISIALHSLTFGTYTFSNLSSLLFVSVTN